MIKPCLLIVDDEDDIRSSIREFVSAEYEVLEAENGMKALSLLQNHKVDLIVTDYNMPGFDGFELIKSLTEMSLRIPIIVLTGRGSQDLHGRVLAYDVFEYIEKPFHPTALRASLRKGVSYGQSPEFHERSNIFEKAYYDNIQVRLPKDTVEKLQERCRAQGISLSTLFAEFSREYLKSAS